MPVLAIGGAASFGEHVGEAMKLVADDVQSVVIPGAGHFVAEEAPEEMLAALTAFLAPYRGADGGRGRHPDARFRVRSHETPPATAGSRQPLPTRAGLRSAGATSDVFDQPHPQRALGPRRRAGL